MAARRDPDPPPKDAAVPAAAAPVPGPASPDARLILVRGVPGSGKSTYARSLGIPDHFEADMYFERNGGYDPAKVRPAHLWCLAMVIAAMEAGRPVVVSNTFIRFKDMRPYKAAAARFGYAVEERIMTGTWPSIHGVPEAEVMKMRLRFQYSDPAPPTKASQTGTPPPATAPPA